MLFWLFLAFFFGLKYFVGCCLLALEKAKCFEDNYFLHFEISMVGSISKVRLQRLQRAFFCIFLEKSQKVGLT